MKRIFVLSLAAVMAVSLLAGCSNASAPSASSLPGTPPSTSSFQQSVEFSAAAASEDLMAGYPDATLIRLSDSGILVNEAAAPTVETAPVYIANDIVFYPKGQDFTFGEGTKTDEHSQAEADAHTVVHISQPGTYLVTGTLSAGQIAVDLGEEAKEDPEAVVTLVLNGADITCTVAPAVIFYQVYECGSDDPDTASAAVDTSAAGANVVLADGSINNVQGSYVARIYKSVTLSDDGTKVVDSKKLHKYDGAFYSRRSMNINGDTGILNIRSENEGMNSELHLTLNGGIINIYSGNDGINTNEDNVSVTTVNGGSLNIVVEGGTGEGDGIDSNGWLVFNGGTVTVAACSTSADSGIDADMGIHLNGGTVTASGNMFDHIAEASSTYLIFSFASRQNGGSPVLLKDESGSTIAQWTPANHYTYLVVADPAIAPGTYTLWSGSIQLAAAAGQSGGFGFGGMMGGMPPQFSGGVDFPNGFELPDDFKLPEGMETPDAFRPEGGMGRPQNGPMPQSGFHPSEGGFPQGDFQMPEGGFPQGDFTRPGNGGSAAESQLSTQLIIIDGANFFSGITPAAAQAQPT